MEGHAVIEGNLKKQVSLRILPKKCPPHLLQFHLPCTTYLLNELLQAWQKPHFLWTVRRSSKSITMTPNNSIQMSKFRSSGDMSLVKGYLHTNKMFDTIHAQDFVDRLSCLSAAAATPPCCRRRCHRRRLCLEPWTPLKYYSVLNKNPCAFILFCLFSQPVCLIWLYRRLCVS